jgi:hypothetical protein
MLVTSYKNSSGFLSLYVPVKRRLIRVEVFNIVEFQDQKDIIEFQQGWPGIQSAVRIPNEYGILAESG